MAEWLKAHAWKACILETESGVRIPSSLLLKFDRTTIDLKMKRITLLFMAFALFLNVSTATAEKSPIEDTTVASQVVDTIAAVAVSKPKEVKKALSRKEEVPKKKYELYEVIKVKFIEGGVGFMSIILICLILGLAIAIERIIALNLSSTNIHALLSNTQNKLKNEGVEAAKAFTSNVPGPVASIFTQGLIRYKKGIDSIEKSIIQYGGVEMAKLERGMTWVALFISLAPMFGFMGTVIGMIDAFDQIQQSETIKIDEVASGIKVALLTTVAGLIVAVILQVFYNYCISKIDTIVSEMEEASISFVDMLIEEELVDELKA